MELLFAILGFVVCLIAIATIIIVVYSNYKCHKDISNKVNQILSERK